MHHDPLNGEWQSYNSCFTKMAQISLAAQNSDGRLSIFDGWHELLIVLVGLAAHGGGFRV